MLCCAKLWGSKDMFGPLTCEHVTQLLSAMVAKLGNMDDPLPQESFEGVDEDEWVSDCNR